MNSAPVSVVIVNWNHRRFLQDCLEAVFAQDYAALDVTVVDNGSEDDSAQWLADHYPEVRLWTFAENRGFSAALNWGVRQTEGDLVLSLNPDTIAQDGFVRELVRVMEVGPAHGERIGAVAPKLLRADDPAILDSTGLFVDRRRRTYDRGQGEIDRGQYDAEPYVFGACGAAALYRRAMLDDLLVEGECFDESFFAYYEDADLAWRAQLRGWRCIYAPSALATHARGWGDTLRRPGHASKSTSGPRLALRNRYLMTLKNDTISHFMSDLPWILSSELPRLAYAAVSRPGILLGLVDLIRDLPQARRKRRQIRSGRIVEDAEIRRWLRRSR